MRLSQTSFDEESMSVGDDDTPMAQPPPLSPPGGAESLFLAGLTASRLSAAALSDQLRSTPSSVSGYRRRVPSFDSRSVASGGRSVATDDFMSCVENPSDLDELDEAEATNSHHHHRPFNRFFFQIPESEHEGETQADNNNSNVLNNIMASFYSSTKFSSPTSTPKMAPKPETPSTLPPPSSVPDLSKIDAAEVVYAKAKDVWAWGKTAPVLSFLVGTTETVAAKALDVAGTNFSALDARIAEELAKLDTGILNPALETIAKVVISAAAHSEEHLKPFIFSILTTVGMIKSEAQEANPEVYTSTPELTTK